MPDTGTLDVLSINCNIVDIKMLSKQISRKQTNEWDGTNKMQDACEGFSFCLT